MLSLFIFFPVKENEPKENARVPLNPAREKGPNLKPKQIDTPFSGGLTDAFRYPGDIGDHFGRSSWSRTKPSNRSAHRMKVSAWRRP